MPRMTADTFARVLRRLEAGDSVPQAAEAEDVTVRVLKEIADARR